MTGVRPAQVLPTSTMFRPLLIAFTLCGFASVSPAWSDDVSWPPADADSRPWLRWWWPSDLSCPEEPDAELEAFSARGFGGVEVIPLGAERDSLWPGPGWAPRASATAKKAEQLKMGFDLASHAGTRPMAYGTEDSSREWIPFQITVQGGPVRLKLPDAEVQCLAAWPPQGLPVNLIDSIDPSTHELVWEAPIGTWQIFGLFDEASFEGLDPFSPTAIKDSLFSFDLALADYDAPFPRSRPLQRTAPEFADWTPGFFEPFLTFRGYDLREQLPALLGAGPAGVVERVRCDYRETLSDLYRLSLVQWQEHTRNQGSLTRSLLHGQPAHPLEIHGVADFPGVASLADSGHELHFAASAAHLTMKPMVVVTVTPGADVTPAILKKQIDHLWLQGANHLILDGRTSLLDPSIGLKALDDTSGLWTNIGPFSDYITRCQSILQHGAPDPDLLLYFPSHDFWTERGGIPSDPVERVEWLRPTGYQRTFEGLTRRGVLFDSVSDLLIRHAEVVGDGQILIGGLTYQGIILPEVRRMPERTAHKLLELTRRGARIGVLGELPQDVPGFPSPDIRRGTLIQSFQRLSRGSTMESDYLDELIEHLGVKPEPMAQAGLRFIRRSHPEGYHYFVVNPGQATVTTSLSLARPTQSLVQLDPTDHRASGQVKRHGKETDFTFNLRLDPGETVVLRTFSHRDSEGPMWSGPEPSSENRTIGGDWTIHFDDQAPISTSLLGSWQSLPRRPIQHRPITACYELEFGFDPTEKAILDLGEVAYTAKVRLNGLDLGASYAPPHRFPLGNSLKKGNNQLEITVTSLANPKLPAGLIGPVRIITPSH